MSLDNLEKIIREKEDELNNLKEKHKKESIIKSSVVERVSINEFYGCIDGCLKFSVGREENNKIDDLRFNSYNYFKDFQEASAYVSFFKLQIKLLRIRDKVRDGWKPDWNNNEQKCCLYYTENYLAVKFSRHSRSILAFQNEETMQKFTKLADEELIKKYLSF